jgi:hypothetical protein
MLRRSPTLVSEGESESRTFNENFSLRWVER